MLPAFDYTLKASHLFNLLDARGVVSPTERQSFIARVRDLAKGCAQQWAESQQ
ncbi:MAG TPA: glycine--tRNA ligase subunit alpha [Terricaulis sp.]|nr:glycine--tRNA ligase subunit alpha [Terricaulis sp.]